MNFEPRDSDSHPLNASPAYRSTARRAPTLAPLPGPAWPDAPLPLPEQFAPADADLLSNARQQGEPLGERMIVAGQVVDGGGQPLAGVLVEIWQANAAGRYAHAGDQHDAPLDPNFSGCGRALTDAQGGFRFLTLRPGAYPWGNANNAWRPPHIHFSVLGRSLAQRLITQMYFPGDPLLDLDPIFQSVPAGARARLVAQLDMNLTEPDVALGYRFDLVLRGPSGTPEVS